MPADLKTMYEGILAACGGADNIVTLGCCMTRLRFTVKDEALVSPEALRQVKDVAGYFFSGSQHQLIVGPSTAGKLAAYFRERHSFAPLTLTGGGVVADTEIGETKENKSVLRKKYSSRLSRACAIMQYLIQNAFGFRSKHRSTFISFWKWYFLLFKCHCRLQCK